LEPTKEFPNKPSTTTTKIDTESLLHFLFQQHKQRLLNSFRSTHRPEHVEGGDKAVRRTAASARREHRLAAWRRHGAER